MKPSTKHKVTIGVTLALAAYAIITCAWASGRSRSQMCMGLQDDRIRVLVTDSVNFVQADSLTRELAPYIGNLTAKKVHEVDLAAIHHKILSLDKIEDAEVVMLNNNKLRITVTPLIPVARVWRPGGKSFYVNREGKSMAASPRYHIDVPQVYGNYSSRAVLPLLDYLKAHPEVNRTVSMISVTDSANIFLIPAFRGPVVNMGDAENLDSKFNHLREFYKTVCPAKGWVYYDTVSLKWDNQIVATRRKNKLPNLDVELIDELENEGPDAGTIDTNSDT